MLKDYLQPSLYNNIVKNFNFKDINEIRMRLNERLIISIKNKKYYLKDEHNNYIVTSKTMLENFITRASENSLYAFNDNIINGFITLKNGIRVGISGNVVSENNIVKTIKDFQSVNIRIPHAIKNCSLPAYDFLVKENNVFNTLIISSPGSGKTTFLRDFIYQLAQHGVSSNVLVADERNEICNLIYNDTHSLSGFCDVYTNCTKQFAFKNGIRSMKPDIIVTDELDLDKDLDCLIDAMNSGVNVVATIHALDINQLRRKHNFEHVLTSKYFSRFVVLTDLEGPGTLSYIYDENLNCIYCRWLWNGF